MHVITPIQCSEVHGLLLWQRNCQKVNERCSATLLTELLLVVLPLQLPYLTLSISSLSCIAFNKGRNDVNWPSLVITETNFSTASLFNLQLHIWLCRALNDTVNSMHSSTPLLRKCTSSLKKHHFSSKVKNYGRAMPRVVVFWILKTKKNTQQKTPACQPWPVASGQHTLFRSSLYLGHAEILLTTEIITVFCRWLFLSPMMDNGKIFLSIPKNVWRALVSLACAFPKPSYERRMLKGPSSPEEACFQIFVVRRNLLRWMSFCT